MIQEMLRSSEVGAYGGGGRYSSELSWTESDGANTATRHLSGAQRGSDGVSCVLPSAAVRLDWRAAAAASHIWIRNLSSDLFTSCYRDEQHPLTPKQRQSCCSHPHSQYWIHFPDLTLNTEISTDPPGTAHLAVRQLMPSSFCSRQSCERRAPCYLPTDAKWHHVDRNGAEHWFHRSAVPLLVPDQWRHIDHGLVGQLRCFINQHFVFAAGRV